MALPTTRWTLIRQATEAPTSEARLALESLCRQYSPPVLAFVRSRVSSPEKAEDITQGFFARLLEHRMLGRVDQERGRFRSFLFHTLRAYMADVYDHDNAQKRGGGNQAISLAAEGVTEPNHAATAEQQFELQWVRTLLQHALLQLEREYNHDNKGHLFDALRCHLDADGRKLLKDTATDLRMSETAVRVALHRLRKRLGQLIRNEISETVPQVTDVDDELNRLRQILETKV